MSYTITSTAGKIKQGLNEYTCESMADLEAIPKNIRSFGDIATIIGTGEKFICDSKRAWKSTSCCCGGGSGSGGGDYVITEADYEAIAQKVKVPSKVSELENDSNFISEVKVNGEVVLNKNGSVDLSISDLNAIIGENVVCNKTLGGVPAGTEFSADTPISEIIKALFGMTEIIPTKNKLYYGLFDSNPLSIDGLNEIDIDKKSLLSSGYTYRNINTDNQIVVVAIPRSFGIECYEISVNGFGIGFNVLETEDYLIYYDFPSTGSYRYVYNFEEV